MDSKDNKSEWTRLIKSFSYAFQGLKTAFLHEHNLQIHVLISCIVIAMGISFQINKMEWAIILMLIGGMITFELLNTAIEKVVDLVTKEFHPLAKLAKDISAGAVLLYAITSVIIGILIFLPYFIR